MHVERGDGEAKVWLDPTRVASSSGFSKSEIRAILGLVNENREIIQEAWNEFFRNRS